MGININEYLNKIKEYLKKIDFKKASDSLKKIDIKKAADVIKNIDLKKTAETIKNIDLRKIKIEPSKIKKNYIWILLGILIGAIVLTRTVGKIKQVLFGPKAEDVKEMVEFLETSPVKVYKVKLMDFKDTLPVMGRIEGVREIELRFDGKGILESFNFEEGERILEGDIIASLDQKDALLKLKYASLELEKAKKLFEVGGVDKIAVDQKKLEYESAKRDLEKTNIYASSDGYLGSKEKHAGSYVTSQDKVGSFVDYSEVSAAFDVIEEDSPKVELGQNVEIFVDAQPGSSYAGTIDMVSPVIQGRTRTQKVQIELDNEDNELKPGMFARAIINTYEKRDALIIPASSFKKKENKYFVYVVHTEGEEGAEEKPEGEEEEMAASEMGTVEEREIEIEYLTHDVAEVAKGVKEGELLIRELHQEYKDKDKVEITEIQETLF
ncbi:MAG: efflux RND transporter periplasmic adaptor subunit [Candidatus Omnitrophota bacterium]